jgi:hypothetical protein
MDELYAEIEVEEPVLSLPAKSDDTDSLATTEVEIDSISSQYFPPTSVPSGITFRLRDQEYELDVVVPDPNERTVTAVVVVFPLAPVSLLYNITCCYRENLPSVPYDAYLVFEFSDRTWECFSMGDRLPLENYKSALYHMNYKTILLVDKARIDICAQMYDYHTQMVSRFSVERSMSLRVFPWSLPRPAEITFLQHRAQYVLYILNPFLGEFHEKIDPEMFTNPAMVMRLLVKLENENTQPE